MLLDGELNIVVCPSCGEMFYAEHFMIYFDPSEELLAFVFPEARKREKEKCSKEMREKFENIKLESNSYVVDYEPMVFFGLESLMEFLVKQEENELEIQVVEKLADEFEAVHIRTHDAFQRQLKYRPREHFCPEPVHPYPSGHMVIALALLEGLGW